MKRKALFICIAVATALALSCGKKKKNEESSAGSSGVDGVANQLAVAYPGGLALSVFPEESSTSLLNSEPRSLKKKKEEAVAVLDGKKDSCLSPAIKRAKPEEAETCYEFDQEMIFGKRDGGTDKGTKNGKNSAGEACLVAFARAKVKETEGIIERRLGMMQSMLCQAKKDNGNVNLPGEGQELDLKPALVKALESMPAAGKPTVQVAKIKRLANQNDRPVYRYEVKFTKGSKSREFYVIHSPVSESDNNEYRGVMWSKSGANTDGKERHLSIRYALTNKDGKPELAGELIRGSINSSISANAFVNGKLDLNVNADFEVATTDPNYGKPKDENGNYYADENSAVERMTYISFQQKITDNSGTVSYWHNPGGRFKESARGMVFELSNGSGTLKGCGTSGAAGSQAADGMSIRRKLKAGSSEKLKAKGFFHPFFNHDTNNCNAHTDVSGAGTYTYEKVCGSDTRTWHKPDTTASLVDAWTQNKEGTTFTKQCVKFETDKYVIDTDVITETAGYKLTNTAADAIVSPDLEAVLGTFSPVE